MANIIPETKPTSDAHKKVTDYHKKLVEKLQQGRLEIMRNALENVMYFLGHQWITFDNLLHNFRNTNVRPGVPRPVVNMFKPKVKKLIALLASIEPSLVASPTNDTEVDRLTADSCLDIIGYIEKTVGLEELRLQLATCVGLCSNAFLVTGFDSDGGPTERIQKWGCENGHMCSADKAMESELTCPECEEPMSPSDDESDEVPQGAVTTDVATVFEILIDWTIPRPRDQPAFIWRRTRPLEWLYARHPEMRGKMPEDTSPTDIGLTYLQNIIRLAPSLGGRFGGSSRFTQSCVIDDMYVLPCKEFPKGQWSRLLMDGRVLDTKPYPFQNGTEEEPGKAFLALTHFGFDNVPGTMMCVGPADDLKSPQRERNRLLSAVQMYFARTANSLLWMPEGVDVQSVHGIEGQVLRGNTTAAGGGAPQRIEAAQLSPAFVKRFEQIDNEMNEIIALYDLQDEAPRIDSGYAMQVLEEKKHQAHIPLFKKFENSYVEWARGAFHIFRNFAPDSLYTKIAGANARWSFKQIKSADLRGGVDIDVEANSGQPKTALQKRAMYEQAVKMGVADPVNDPKTKLFYARMLGVKELMHGFDVDMRQIAREHDAVIAWAKEHFDMETGEPKPGDINPEESWPVFVDPDIDNLQLHWMEHRSWQMTEEFENLPPAVKEIFRIVHFQPHAMLLGVQMQMPAGPQAMQSENPGAQAPPGAGQGAPGSPAEAESAGNAGAQATAGGGGNAERSGGGNPFG